jgi:hypothetical protein
LAAAIDFHAGKARLAPLPSTTTCGVPEENNVPDDHLSEHQTAAGYGALRRNPAVRDGKLKLGQSPDLLSVDLSAGCWTIRLHVAFSG